MIERLEITRETIESGQLEEFLIDVEKRGLLDRSSPEYREQTQKKAISHFDPSEDIWLFAYGSLLWNPTIAYEEIRLGHLFGFHRRFCLQTLLGRGTPECPGLMLALDYGGSCKGLAYRISRKLAENELKIIWNREMVSNSYVAKVVRLKTETGPLKAITFAINRENKRYSGKLAINKIADVVAISKGPMGSCIDYLFQTIDKLTEHGLTDSHLDKLARLVQERL